MTITIPRSEPPLTFELFGTDADLSAAICITATRKKPAV